MNAISTNYGAGFAESAPPPRSGRYSEAPGAGSLGRYALGLGLQLSRANAMALTRLQLALCTGERHQALEAIDRLHALDAQLERLVARIEDAPENDGDWHDGDWHDGDWQDGDWRALSTHLADQKLALAFEKLALASGISGPDMTSPSPAQPNAAQPNAQPHAYPNSGQPFPQAAPGADGPPLVDWHAFPAVQPAEWNPFANRRVAIGVAAVLALVVLAALAAAVVAMTGI